MKKRYAIVNTRDSMGWLFKGNRLIEIPKGTIVEVSYDDGGAFATIYPTSKLIDAGYSNNDQIIDSEDITPLNYKR